MAVNRTGNNAVYGFNNPLQGLQPALIFAERNPETTDRASLGTMWINTDDNAYFVLTSANTWTAQASGSSTVSTLDITGGSGTVLNVAASGNTVLGGDLSVAGGTVLSGTLLVEDTLTINGSVEVDSSSLVSITSTLNSAPAIQIATDGGPSEAIVIVSNQGTGGGADIIPAVLIGSVAGGVSISAAKDIRIDSGDTGAVAMNFISAGNINLTAARNLQLKSTRNFAGSVSMTADGGTSETIVINSLQGTGNSAVGISASSGGITLAAATLVTVTANNTGMILLQPLVVNDTTFTTTSNTLIGKIILTNLTLAVSASQVIFVFNTQVGTTSAILLNAAIYSLLNNAQATISNVQLGAGYFQFTLTNDGAGNLLATDTINIAFQVL